MSDTTAHHRRFEYCRTRLHYRNGRQLKAVKVYTVANESRHLLVFGVPRINLQQELKSSLQRFGPMDSIKNVSTEMAQKMELELFTDVFHVKYKKIEHARRAKAKLDRHEFYGGILHISYAPELETREELRAKLEARRLDLNFRLAQNARHAPKKPKT